MRLSVEKKLINLDLKVRLLENRVKFLSNKIDYLQSLWEKRNGSRINYSFMVNKYKRGIDEL